MLALMGEHDSAVKGLMESWREDEPKPRPKPASDGWAQLAAMAGGQ